MITRVLSPQRLIVLSKYACVYLEVQEISFDNEHSLCGDTLVVTNPCITPCISLQAALHAGPALRLIPDLILGLITN